MTEEWSPPPSVRIALLEGFGPMLNELFPTLCHTVGVTLGAEVESLGVVG